MTVFFFIFIFSASIYSPDLLNISNEGEGYISSSVFKNLTSIIALVGTALLFFLLGFFDDFFNFRAITKITLQVLFCMIYIHDTDLFQITGSAFFNYLYTLTWLVGITNAANLIDNFDGICSSVVSLSAIALLLLLTFQNNDVNLFYVIAILSILIGCLIGFLLHNFPPATIFMGDSGSMALGFIIASVSIPTQMSNHFGLGDEINIAKALIPICVLSFPIFDTTLVTLSRIKNNKKIYHGGRDHTAHRLSVVGLSNTQVLLVIMIYSMIGIFVSFLIFTYKELMISIFLIYFLINAMLLFYFLRREKSI
ncbi:undecaprenyl/decaprenyl-phosphate alpha-N-acetylglucosaminyl 1-phosphate transferase [Gammaproteobacteria bacterium]|nr:undecaprenyl/decaprenyl-phosphate alpha-N-acetylglucosaminyl 1-phosphate transferase [Gammaproteobacteria bacterium]